MLVLTRRKNEAIIIGDDITIVVVEISWNKVRLGIKAPKDVTVDRKEVFEAKARQDHNVDPADSEFKFQP